MLWRRLFSHLKQARPVRATVARPPTPAELRVHLPLLWPHGPDGPLDEAALRSLGRDYARAGRAMDELLSDLDLICSVVGIGVSSRMIEASSVAWSDAFLDTVASGSTPEGRRGDAVATAQDAALEEVERRLGTFRAGAWGDLSPSGHLLLITWESASDRPDARRLREELGRVAEEVRQVFPGAAVAQQSHQRRVIAAVTESPDTAGRVAALQARCAELVTTMPPTVTVAPAPPDADTARRLLQAG